MSYIYIKTPKQADKFCKLLEGCQELAHDCETYCLPEWVGKFRVNKDDQGALNPHTGRISLFMLQGRKDKTQVTPVIIFDFIELTKQDWDFTPLFNVCAAAHSIVAHFAQFDAMFFLGHFKRLPHRWHCTRTMSQIIGNATGSKVARVRGHSLNDCLRDWLGVKLEGKGTLQKSTWAARPWDSDGVIDDQKLLLWQEKLKYAAGDVQYLFPLRDKMFEVINNPLPFSELTMSLDSSLESPYGLGMYIPFMIDMADIPSVAIAQYVGMGMDEAILTDISRSLVDEGPEGRLTRLTARLCQEFGLPVDEDIFTGGNIPNPKSLKVLNNPNKLKSLIKEKLGVNLTSVQYSTIERLFTLYATKAESTSSDPELITEWEEENYTDILMLDESVAASGSALLKDVLEFKKLVKQHSTNLRKYINPVTGRIHPVVNISGAATGRSSSRDPNCQAISSRATHYVKRKITGDRFLGGACPAPKVGSLL